MATMPQDENEMMGAPDAETGPGEPSLAYEICIRVMTDQSIAVGVESAEQEAAEEQSSGMEGEPGAKPAANIKDALTQALEIFKAGGKMADDGGDDAAFMSGYAQNDRGPARR